MPKYRYRQESATVEEVNIRIGQKKWYWPIPTSSSPSSVILDFNRIITYDLKMTFSPIQRAVFLQIKCIFRTVLEWTLSPGRVQAEGGGETCSAIPGDETGMQLRTRSEYFMQSFWCSIIPDRSSERVKNGFYLSGRKSLIFYTNFCHFLWNFLKKQWKAANLVLSRMSSLVCRFLWHFYLRKNDFNLRQIVTMVLLQ